MMSLKIGVKKIIDLCKSKDNVKFYKVQWQETWLHERYLNNWQHLVREYYKEQGNFNEDEFAIQKDYLKNSYEDPNEEVANNPCFFCSSKDLPGTELNRHEKTHIEEVTSADLLTKQNDATMYPTNFQDSFMLLCPVRGDMKCKSGPRKKPIAFTTASRIVEATLPKVEFNAKLKTTTKSGDVPFPLNSESRQENQQDHQLSEATQLFNDTVGDVLVKKSDVDGSPIYVCPKCNKEFSRYSVFRLHHHSHQSEELNSAAHSCQTCIKKFTTITALEKHSKLHGQGKYKKFRNQLYTACNQKKKKKATTKPKNYYNQRKAKDFIKLFQPSTDSSMSKQPQEKPSQESLSSQMLTQLSNSQSSMSREPEFTAEVLKSARQYIKAVSKRRKEYTLQRIMSNKDQPECVRKKHSVTGLGVDVELQPSEQSLPIVSQHNGRFSYSCKVCGKSFFNKFHHREHFNVHSGEMPYECEFCTKRFAQRSGWNRHIKLHHKYDVFQGPIPYSSTQKLINNLKKKKETEVFTAQTPTSTVASVPSNDVVQRYIPIAPYPTSSIPIVPAMLSPEQFPTPLNGLVIHPPSILTNVSQITSVNVNPNAKTVIASIVPNKTAPKELQVVFQCKKVRSMDGRFIFMVRLAPQCMHKIEELERKQEFAYVLDSCGNVDSRIFVSDHPGDDWVDFPLDPLANEILIDRLNTYCDKNRRGPKNRVATFSPTKRDSTSTEKASLDEAFTEFRQRYAFFTSGTNVTEITSTTAETTPVNTSVSIISHTPPFYTPPSVATIAVSTQLAEKKTVQNDPNQLQPIPKETYGRKFTSGKEKRFSCSLCGRKFLAQAHLNDHMKIHTGELPFKCMFCGRPFRHKSGLNSHHKRHIQNGVFDRPISSFKIKEPVVGDSDLRDVSNSPETTASIEKPKRKQRTPKHVERHIESETSNYQNDDDDILLHIKEEVDDNDETMTSLQYDENIKIEFNSPDANEMFDCNFCGLTFTLRTTYLKHVSTVHKVTNNAYLNDNSEAEGNMDSYPESNLDNDFRPNSDTTLKSSFLENANLETPDENISEDENLFLTEIKIKEEVMDY